MAKPPKFAKPPQTGVRYLYTPVYMRRHDEDAFSHCIITLEQCEHKLLAEHDHAQLRFRFPVNDDGTCPRCGSPIGGQFRWEFYTEGALDPGALAVLEDQDEADSPPAQAPKLPGRHP